MTEYDIPKVFNSTCDKFSGKVALRYKKDGVYQDINYSDFRKMVRNTSMGLLSIGIKHGDRVAILSKNRPEWAVADLGIQSVGAINVPVYDTFLAPQVEYILTHSDAKVIICSTQEQLDKIMKVKDNVTSLIKVVVMDSLEDSKKPEYVMSMNELMEQGSQKKEKYETLLSEQIDKIKGDDLCSIVYTSGTTGHPKGVMLSHKNFISNVENTLKAVPITSEDTVLSFLPLSHVLERMGGYYTILYAGGTIAYAESIDTVGDNMGEIRPTIMISVPRLYEKMYAKILDKVESGSPVKQKIFKWATSVGKRMLEAKKSGSVPAMLNLQFSIAKKLAFDKLKNKTGGKLRFFVSGGAPLAKYLGEFFGSADISILEGYGLTESSPVITCNRLDNYKFGSVGLPISGVKIEIADDGEILASGPNIMQGYFKDEAGTSEVLEVINDETWLHTGDIGYLDEEGFLNITDRKKEIIVMSNGKNVAPQPLETILKTGKFISQAVMIGNEKKFMSALIIPDFEKLENYAKENEISFSERGKLIESPEIKKLFDTSIEELIKDLPRYEQLKKYCLLPRELTLEENELTPTLKLKRSIIEDHFSVEISNLYGDAD